MRILGVDPGISGALALYETSIDALMVSDMPVALSGTGHKREVVPALVAAFLRDWTPDVCLIERVHAMPGQGVTSMFNFGRSYGVVLGVLAALQIRTVPVLPGAWKRTVGLGHDKSGARAMAIRLFPAYAHLFERVKDDGRAEAVLLAWSHAKNNTHVVDSGAGQEHIGLN